MSLKHVSLLNVMHCFRSEEMAIIEAAKNKHPYPEFNVGLGNTHFLHYRGDVNFFSLGKIKNIS